MGSKYYKLPERAVLERYAPRVQSNIIRRYHDRLATKSDWYISGKNVYIAGDMPEKEEYANARLTNCNWTQEMWDVVPYEYQYIPQFDRYIEVYRTFKAVRWASLECPKCSSVSKTIVNGELTYLEFHSAGWQTNAYYFPLTGEIKMNMPLGVSSMYTTYHKDGIITQGAFCRESEVKSANTDYIMPILRKMNAKQYRGFYNELIDAACEAFKLNKTQI